MDLGNSCSGIWWRCRHKRGAICWPRSIPKSFLLPIGTYRVRRKKFYRNLGCREVEGFNYIMPPLSRSTPPAMDLMVYRRDLPEAIAKALLREWVEDIYVARLLAAAYRSED